MPSNNKPQKADSGQTASSPLGDVVMIYATFPDRDMALKVGRDLVDTGLAGCINVLPAMTSLYVWKGAAEMAEESVMIAKLGREGAERAVAHIVANHPYETPAVVILPVLGGNHAYLAWLREGTKAE